MTAVLPEPLNPQNEQRVNILLKEYDALKAEQRARIGFRDGLLYTTIAAVGAIATVAMGGFATRKEPVYEALLLIPWVTTILGWTYVVNDQKITAIRRHVEHALSVTLRQELGFDPKAILFPWEPGHRKSNQRSTRKHVQLAIDIWTFVFSGGLAVVAYWSQIGEFSRGQKVVVGVDIAILVVLAIQIFLYWWDATHESADGATG